MPITAMIITMLTVTIIMTMNETTKQNKTHDRNMTTMTMNEIIIIKKNKQI